MFLFLFLFQAPEEDFLFHSSWTLLGTNPAPCHGFSSASLFPFCNGIGDTEGGPPPFFPGRSVSALPLFFCSQIYEFRKGLYLLLFFFLTKISPPPPASMRTNPSIPLFFSDSPPHFHSQGEIRLPSPPSFLPSSGFDAHNHISFLATHSQTRLVPFPPILPLEIPFFLFPVFFSRVTGRPAQAFDSYQLIAMECPPFLSER